MYTNIKKPQACKFGASCINTSCTYDHSASSQLQICRFWKLGTCTKGSSCKFFHGDVPTPNVEKASLVHRPQEVLEEQKHEPLPEPTPEPAQLKTEVINVAAINNP